MTIKTFLTAATFAICSPVFALDPTTSSMGYIQCPSMSKFKDGVCSSHSGGLSGGIVITTQSDWVPRLLSGESMALMKNDQTKPDEKVVAMLFVTNPTPNALNKISLVCDISISKPDGALALQSKNHPCYDGKNGPKGANIFVTHALTKFSFDANDPTGLWMISMVVHDQTGKTSALIWSRIDNKGPR